MSQELSIKPALKEAVAAIEARARTARGRSPDADILFYHEAVKFKIGAYWNNQAEGRKDTVQLDLTKIPQELKGEIRAYIIPKKKMESKS